MCKQISYLLYSKDSEPLSWALYPDTIYPYNIYICLCPYILYAYSLHNTCNRWLLRNRCARSEWSRLSDLFKAFVTIEIGHKHFFLLKNRPVFLHTGAISCELPSSHQYHDILHHSFHTRPFSICSRSAASNR